MNDPTATIDARQVEVATYNNNPAVSDDNQRPKRSRKPIPLHPHPMRIPVELRNLTRWIAWTYFYRNGWTKSPIKVTPGEKFGQFVSVTDPNNWGTFTEAVTYWSKHRKSASGIGFCLTDMEGEEPVAAIDLDHCLDPQTGIIEPWAKEIVDSCPGYWEHSPGGDGLRCLGYGKVTGKIKQGRVEIYSNIKYVTVTGHSLSREKNQKLTNIQATLDRIQEEFSLYGKTACGQAPNGERIPVTPKVATLAEDTNLISERPYATPTLHAPTEAEIIRRASEAANGAEFLDLWNGGGPADHSAADLALCNYLAFWVGPNPHALDSLFRQSGQMRDKWDSKRGAETYGKQTITKALAGRTVYFDWDGAARAKRERDAKIEAAEEKRVADRLRDYEARVASKQAAARKLAADELDANADFNTAAMLRALLNSRGLPITCRGLERALGCGMSRHLRKRCDHSQRLAGRLTCRRWSCQYCRARHIMQRGEHFAGIFAKHDSADIPLAIWCGSAKQIDATTKRIKRAGKEYVAVLQPGGRFVVITNAGTDVLSTRKRDTADGTEDRTTNTSVRTLPRGGAIIEFVEALAEIPEHLPPKTRPIRTSRFWQRDINKEPSQYEVDPQSDSLAVQFTPEQIRDLLRGSNVPVKSVNEFSDGFDRADFYVLPDYAWRNFTLWICTFETACPPDILWRKPEDGPCPFLSLFTKKGGGKRKDENGQDAKPPGRDRAGGFVTPSVN